MTKFLKKWTKVLLLVLVAMYIFQRPNNAANSMRRVWQSAVHGVSTLADSGGRFLDTLLSPGR